MTEHLPGCPWHDQPKCYVIEGSEPPVTPCDLLRACEQRIREGAAKVWEQMSYDTGFAAGRRSMQKYLLADDENSYAAGHREGVAAARDAVADRRVPWPTATGDLVNEGIDTALAAIDALVKP